MENTKMIKSMVKALISGRMVENILVSGLMVSNMGLVLIIRKKEWVEQGFGIKVNESNGRMKLVKKVNKVLYYFRINENFYN